MQSHFEILVTLNGAFFFSTSERSGLDRMAASRVARELAKRFPESEGYAVTVIQWEARGRFMPVVEGVIVGVQQ